MWENLSAADVVRRIYHHLAIGRLDLSAYRFDVFNSLGIPTCVQARRSRRSEVKRTQGLWRSGHIRNLVVNPVYKGILQYGRTIYQTERP